MCPSDQSLFYLVPADVTRPQPVVGAAQVVSAGDADVGGEVEPEPMIDFVSLPSTDLQILCRNIFFVTTIRWKKDTSVILFLLLSLFVNKDIGDWFRLF